MIPTIGIMIGCYIITRRLSLVSKTGSQQESLGTRIAAAITFAVCVFGIIGLFFTSSKL